MATVDRTSWDSVHAWMREHLVHVPEAERRAEAERVVAINRLKVERDAVVLGHNYMSAALYHLVADITGDSLQLCRRAAETSHKVIVFCGVAFMAESAKVISPDRTVLIPSREAGCSLAESITAEDVRRLKAHYPGVPVVTYVNTNADVKAETDVCCTSSNAARVVESLDAETVLFLPDQYLGRNVARDTGRAFVLADRETLPDVPAGKAMIGWRGACEVHELFTADDVARVRREYPGVYILAHPECPPDVVAVCDFAGSTAAMMKRVYEVDAPHYLLLTECMMVDNMLAADPSKPLLRMCSRACPHMGRITLENTLASLRLMQYEIDVPEPIRVRAKAAIDRMLEIG